ncbi:MAG TPA: thioredoxin family protein [Vicinamibacteria bacterium]|nr:thioredoxin family protein [Vicinamibacteria bacterium]
MTLKDRIHFLTTPEQVDSFVKDNSLAAIFKAGTCHKTNETFQHVQAQLEPREDIPLGVIRVVEARPASNRVAELTGIQHESPQILLFKDGTAVFDRDNWDITAEALAEVLEGRLDRVS